jgi:hypothetical protein
LFLKNFVAFQRELFERISQIGANRLSQNSKPWDRIIPPEVICTTYAARVGEGKCAKHITYSGSIPGDRKLLIQAGQSWTVRDLRSIFQGAPSRFSSHEVHRSMSGEFLKSISSRRTRALAPRSPQVLQKAAAIYESAHTLFLINSRLVWVISLTIACSRCYCSIPCRAARTCRMGNIFFWRGYQST